MRSRMRHTRIEAMLIYRHPTGISADRANARLDRLPILVEAIKLPSRDCRSPRKPGAGQQTFQPDRGDSTNGGKSGHGTGLINCLMPHPNRLGGDDYIIVGASAASFPNSSGVNARTVVVRAFPDDVIATANCVIASPFGISTTNATSY